MDVPANALLQQYFDLLPEQIDQFDRLIDLYKFWNERINVVSRKDMDFLVEHHFLHSLAIAKIISFKSGTHILDVGTGGGFPGVPLAILFPEVEFTLIDSIGKKIKVVENIIGDLGIENIRPRVGRVELIDANQKFDFVVSRAVTRLFEFWPWIRSRFKKTSHNSLDNGLLALKGGDLSEEISDFGKPVRLYSISDFFHEPFFETKKVVYVKNNGKE